MNTELYDKLARATKYYTVESELHEQISEQKSKIETLKRLTFEEKLRKEKPLTILMIITGLPIVPCSVILALSIIITIVEPKYFDGAIAIGSILGPILAIALAFQLLRLILQKKLDNKYATIDKQIVQPKIEKAQKTIEELIETERSFKKEHYEWIGFLPSRYRDLTACSFMLVAVADGEAYTFQEAMSLYDEQLHRWKVENAIRKNAETQEYIARSLDELNTLQEETNDRLRRIQEDQYFYYMHKK